MSITAAGSEGKGGNDSGTPAASPPATDPTAAGGTGLPSGAPGAASVVDGGVGALDADILVAFALSPSTASGAAGGGGGVPLPALASDDDGLLRENEVHGKE